MTVTGKPAQIFDALMVRLEAFTYSPALPLALPDIAYTPDGSAYLDVSYFPNRPRWEGVAAGELSQGILQVTVVWPRGAGLVAPLQVAESIMDHFAKGTIMVSGTTKVKTGQPYVGSPLIAEHETRTPVSIGWTA